MPFSLTFADALRELGPDAGFQIMNQAPDIDYLFATLLPEQNKPDYYIDSAYMTIRTTMAGLVGTSSPYPPGGVIDARTFLEKTAKLALRVELEEEALRTVQRILRDMMVDGATSMQSKEFLMNEALNFMEKVVKQGHDDTREWLRGRALINGKIDWTFNNKHLLVDYGLPAKQFQTPRTGTSSYDGTASMFWADHYYALATLYYNVRAIILHPDTFLKMANQDFNKFSINQTANNVFEVKRYRTRGNGELLTGDTRDTVTFITYDREGEVLDPAYNPATPGSLPTKKIRMINPGEIIYVANNRRSGYRVGEGSTPDPERDAALGYTHCAPTVEGGGMMGKWGELYTPQEAPWSLVGRGAENSLPVPSGRHAVRR